MPKDSTVTGTGTFVFLIQQRSLSGATLTVDDDSLVYNQAAQKPDVTVSGILGNPTDTDYTVSWYDNVSASNNALAIITATSNNFTGSASTSFTILPREITASMIADIDPQPYTGGVVVRR